MPQDYSEWVRQKSDVGLGQVVYDSLVGSNPNISPGFMSSNGVRYAFLRYRASSVPACYIKQGQNRIVTAYAGDDTTISLSSTIK